MMILRSAPPSPFGRKVCIALSLLGLDRDVRVEAADTVDPHDSLREQNPLGKIPVLIAEDGSTFYDSRVILEYLDDRAGKAATPCSLARCRHERHRCDRISQLIAAQAARRNRIAAQSARSQSC